MNLSKKKKEKEEEEEEREGGSKPNKVVCYISATHFTHFLWTLLMYHHGVTVLIWNISVIDICFPREYMVNHTGYTDLCDNFSSYYIKRVKEADGH